MEEEVFYYTSWIVVCFFSPVRTLSHRGVFLFYDRSFGKIATLLYRDTGIRIGESVTIGD